MRFPLAVALCIFVFAPLHAEPARGWEKLEGCAHLADRYFDGDSFQIRHARKTLVLRLYGADAPETDAGLGACLDEQAAYFGVKKEDVLRAGEDAKEFTARFLAKPFTVITRRHIAPGASRSERYYAIVERGGVSLEAALVSAGWARATTEAAEYPDAAAAPTRTRQLRTLEAKARQERKGLWGRSRSTLATVREQLTPRIFKAPAPAAPRFVNLNTASALELESLPGVGPKTAEQIIRARPLKDLAALDAIPGFGPKRIEALRELVTF